jgi:2-polyprenyl-6-methoxyphenol hydroxylase-like FAD-dependent oxidoreductase
MPRDERTEVLIAGAGPIGMLTALLLSQEGVQLRIIDREWRTATRTYAGALHPRSLQLLHQLGLIEGVLAAGRKIGTVAFYQGSTRRAEVRLSELETDYPFVLVLPQSALETLLEDRLKREAKVQVEWNHQISAFQAEAENVVSTVDKLGISAKGYIVPEMEWSIEKSEQVRTRYLVGADGPNSFVAQALGLQYQTAGEAEFYAVFEFESDFDCGDELRVVLDAAGTSVLWPLAGNKMRWSFQLSDEHLAEFPAKERNSLVVDQPAMDRANREFMQRLLLQRAPWFTGTIQELGWCSDVGFEHRYARSFGRGRCWLVGDAAHQTGPAAMQSMNMGVYEAAQLASALGQLLRGKASPDILQAYEDTCQEQWRRLLGISARPQSGPHTDRWVHQHSARLVSCLPATGNELKLLLNQLELDLP